MNVASSWLLAALAAASAGLAAFLVQRPRSRTAPEHAPARALGGWLRWLAAGMLLAAVLVLFDGRRLVLALIALAALAGVRLLVRAHRAAAAAERRRDRVQDFCDALAAELAAGQPPVQALGRVAAELPEFAEVARGADLGVDVPGLLRQASALPGAGDLRLVAASWQVAHRSGAGLTASLIAVADTIRDRRRVARLAVSEMAGSHATARLMAGLPVLILMLGAAIGIDPFRFLLQTPVGLVCLGSGVGLSLLGLGWLYRIQQRVTP